MHYVHKNQGTCSMAVEFDYEDGKVHNVRFLGGCTGNTQGVARLAEGMDAAEIIRRCEGIPCRGNTSCPDQLARGLRQAMEEEATHKTPVSNVENTAAECRQNAAVEEDSEPDCANCPTPCGREKLI